MSGGVSGDAGRRLEKVTGSTEDQDAPKCLAGVVDIS